MKRPILATFFGAASLAAGVASAEAPGLATGVVEAASARSETFEWGELITYFAGDSYAATDSLTAVAIIKAGMEIHPPHVHSEEEYLMVLAGEGTWSVEGREFPAAAGDTLYAAPWDEHGIRNTGTEALKFVVFKWNPKLVEPMPAPAADSGTKTTN
jgi:mannose-6-phosphate isomerase-like protein (cupin superfamily)